MSENQFRGDTLLPDLEREPREVPMKMEGRIEPEMEPEDADLTSVPVRCAPDHAPIMRSRQSNRSRTSAYRKW
jgi:hypothetical protein